MFTYRTAGIESIAKTKSDSSIQIRQLKSGVARSLPEEERVKNEEPE